MNDHKNMPNMDAVITAKTAHNQSVPWLLMCIVAFGGLVSTEPMTVRYVEDNDLESQWGWESEEDGLTNCLAHL